MLMKSFAHLIVFTMIFGMHANLKAQNVPFDVCDSNFFYLQSGQDLIQAKNIAGTMTTLMDCDLKKVGGTGKVNAVACNAKDGFVYYQNRHTATNKWLIRVDANCDTMTVTNFTGLGGFASGCFDACNNYCRWKGGDIIKYNVNTAVYDTIYTTLTGGRADLCYDPFTCHWFVYRNLGQLVQCLDSAGTLLYSFTTSGSSSGGISLSQDGTQIIQTVGPTIYWYNAITGVLEDSKTLADAAKLAPQADNGSFVCDNAMADITSLGDTIFINTCQDSVLVNFTNTSTGDLNVFLWNFDDGDLDSTNLNPSHMFASNNTYNVGFMATKFTCDVCQLDVNNYDTIVVVIAPDILLTTMASTDPICFEGSDGTGTVTTTSGGTAPYAYSWTGSSSTTTTATGFTAGTYYVTVTDANTCTTIDSVTLVDPPDVIAIGAATDVTCNGFTDGTATATPTGGAYTYAWSTTETTTVISTLAPGVYEVIVTDAAGCDTTISVTVGEPPVVTVVTSADTLICIGGTADLNAIGGGGNGGPFTYNWAGVGAGSPSVTPVADACYEVIATDQLGCVSVIGNQCVTLRDPLSLSVTGTNVCPGITSNLYSAYSGGDGAYSFDWTELGSTFATAASTSATPVISGNYCLTLSDGCETPDVTECVFITVFSLPTVSLNSFQACQGTAIDFPALVPAGATDFEWNFGDGSTSGSSAPSHVYVYDGTYTVGVSFITADGCPVSQSFPDIVTMLESPIASFNYNPTDITVEDTEVEFRNQTLNATTYLWEFGDGSPTSNQEDPTHTFPEIGDVAYPVTLWADNGVCTDSITKLIHIKEIIIFYVPNVFTPDGDQYNETFKPIMTSGIDIYDYHMAIYNRWGEIVFESYDHTIGWDGTYGNQGLTKDGVFIWKIDFKETSSDKRHEQTGHVTILK